jgi:hypothetical protein
VSHRLPRYSFLFVLFRLEVWASLCYATQQNAGFLVLDLETRLPYRSSVFAVTITTRVSGIISNGPFHAWLCHRFCPLLGNRQKLSMDSSINLEGLSPKPSNTFGQDRSPDIHHGVPKDWKFWCIIFSLTLSILLTAIELVSYRYLFFLLASLGQ